MGYRFWDDENNCELVKKYFPEYLDKYMAIANGVAKADIARCMYMSIYGGFYFDTDYRVIAFIDDSILSKQCVLPISLGSIRNGVHSHDFRLGNAVFGSEPNYPFWNDFIGHLFQSNELCRLEENRIEKILDPKD